jgi:hypothetical protein
MPPYDGTAAAVVQQQPQQQRVTDNYGDPLPRPGPPKCRGDLAPFGYPCSVATTAVAVGLGMIDQQPPQYSSTSSAVEQQQPSSSGMVPITAEQMTQTSSSSSRDRGNPVGNTHTATPTAANSAHPTDTVRPLKSARAHPPQPCLRSSPLLPTPDP